MTFDIRTLKLLGYNMLRKHIKVEPALYYTAADELGILILQDMPSLSNTRLPNKAQHVEFQRQLEVMITQLRSYTSIFAWVSDLSPLRGFQIVLFCFSKLINSNAPGYLQ